MTNILTASEGAVVLRCSSTDTAMLAMLPGIDAFIKNATGRDWAKESQIPEEAKSAARMLLVLWHENPGMVGGDTGSSNFGLTACLIQLSALAMNIAEFYGNAGAGGCTLKTAMVGDSVDTLTGVIGAAGDQKAAFEGVITVDGEIQQISISDLSANVYRVKLKPARTL